MSKCDFSKVDCFLSVYIIDTTCGDEWFLFYVITGRHDFLQKFIIT